MRITVETNVPLYGDDIVVIMDNYGMILVPDVQDNHVIILEAIKEALQEGDNSNFVSWVSNGEYVNANGRWDVYIPQNINREQCSLLVYPYTDSSEKFIVAQGSYDELYNMKISDYSEYAAYIILGTFSVSRCYESEYSFKAEKYLILS